MPIVKTAIRTPNPGQGICAPWRTPLRPQAMGWTPPNPRPGHTPYRASVSSLPRVHFPQRQILLENSFLRTWVSRNWGETRGLGESSSQTEMRCERRPGPHCWSDASLWMWSWKLQERLLQWGREAEGKPGKQAQANQVSWRAPVPCMWGQMRNAPGYWGSLQPDIVTSGQKHPGCYLLYGRSL